MNRGQPPAGHAKSVRAGDQRLAYAVGVTDASVMVQQDHAMRRLIQRRGQILVQLTQRRELPAQDIGADQVRVQPMGDVEGGAAELTAVFRPVDVQGAHDETFRGQTDHQGRVDVLGNQEVVVIFRADQVFLGHPILVGQDARDPGADVFVGVLDVGERVLERVVF